MEQIDTLALALRGNNTLDQLDIIHASRMGGQSIVRLPVPELNGSRAQSNDQGSGERRLVDMSQTCIEGNIGRVACAMIGTLIAANTSLECIDLSNTGLGLAIGSEGEGGHILLRPMCEARQCPLNEINLSNIQLNDKAGAKLLSALSVGLSKEGSGYEKITSLNLASNDLGKQSAAALKQLLWGERAPCMLQSLNLSNNIGLDGFDTGVAVKRNESLTSIDFTNIPSANSEEIYLFFGSFLLQDDCTCRLGFLSCDAFKIVPGDEALVLKPPSREHANNDVVEDKKISNQGLMSMLAGVLKYNSSLKMVSVAGTGVDNAAASFFATALLENKVLEDFDVSSNPIGPEGATEMAEAARKHPMLTSIKIDGSKLPVSQLRGIKGSEGTLDVTDWGLGHLSGHAIGTIAKQNRTLVSLNLKSNALGASGVAAVVEGLGDAPLKALDVTRNGLGGAASELEALSISICRHLGSLFDLRLDENELDCPAKCLAPLCKLRNLRVLSLEKNRLTEVPSLVGTMTSLRRVILHSNQLMHLPISLCLLTALETLDVHKNHISSLPANIGGLKGLQKLDVSENRLIELPVSICELNEDAQLSVGRNPLEKPSVEQARQGVGAIRRFFGFSRTKGGDESGDLAEAKAAFKPRDEQTEATQRPERDMGQSSRHDWAGPGGVFVLFNCARQLWYEVEGGSDLGTLPTEDDVDILANFNLQKIGRVRAARSHGESLYERVEFANNWLPWRSQEVSANDESKLLCTLKWRSVGTGKASAQLLVIPYLAYACSLGARVKTATGYYATVTGIRPNDECELTRDNAKITKVGPPIPEVVDPQPSTVSRTPAASYKAGQKLMLFHDGVAIDAVVEEWLGSRKGSRHRVRIGSKDMSTKNKSGTSSAAPLPITPISASANEVAGSVGVAAKTAPMGLKETIDVDLNESNHSRLLFPTVARYKDARMAYCSKVLSGKCNVFRDEATSRDLSIVDQRIYIRPYTPAALDAVAKSRTSDVQQGDKTSAGATLLEGGLLSVSAPTSSTTDTNAAYSPALEASSDQGTCSVGSLLDQLLQPVSVSLTMHAPVVIQGNNRAEQELLLNQSLYMLAQTLREPPSSLGPIHLVPIMLSMPRLNELLADEVLVKQGARAVIVKAFELDFPGMGDMLRQAMDLRALVVVAEVTAEADFSAFKDFILDELLINRLVVTISGANAEDGSLGTLTDLFGNGPIHRVVSLGLYMSDMKITSRLLSNLFRRMKAAASEQQPSYYTSVERLHLGHAEVGREGLLELQELMASDGCKLRSIDLSFAEVDIWPVVQALKSNSSLTSLDMRSVAGMSTLYETLAAQLLDKTSTSNLGCLRCDVFDLIESDEVLDLHEVALEPAVVRLIAGLLKRNTVLTDLNLTAADIEDTGATALATVLGSNASLTALRLAYNPMIDETAKDALRRSAQLTLLIDL